MGRVTHAHAHANFIPPTKHSCGIRITLIHDDVTLTMTVTRGRVLRERERERVTT